MSYIFINIIFNTIYPWFILKITIQVRIKYAIKKHIHYNPEYTYSFVSVARSVLNVFFCQVLYTKRR